MNPKNDFLIKCKKCSHYYRIMSTENGYNPFPCCHLYEDTGERIDFIKQTCYQKRQTPKNMKGVLPLQV